MHVSDICQIPAPHVPFSILYIGPYLTPVDLADIATQLDELEKARMAEGDVTSEDYQEFIKVYKVNGIWLGIKNEND